MSSSTRSWRQRVLEADKDFMQESLRPVVYEFSNGRKFRQKVNPYYRFLLTQAGGIIFSEQGPPIEMEGE